MTDYLSLYIVIFNVTRTKTNNVFYIKQQTVQVWQCYVVCIKKKKREAENQHNQFNKQTNKCISPSWWKSW